MFNLAMIGTILTPVLAFAAWKSKLRGEHWFYISVVGLFWTTIYLLLKPLNIAKVTIWLPYYTFFLMVYILLFAPLFHGVHFGKVLAISLWLLFVAAELWEMPIFVHDFLRKTPDLIWWASHIRRVYAVAGFVLMAKVSGFKLNKVNISLFLFGTLIIFALIPEYASPRLNVDIAHVVSLILFGLIGWFGLKDIKLGVKQSDFR